MRKLTKQELLDAGGVEEDGNIKLTLDQLPMDIQNTRIIEGIISLCRDKY